MSERSEELEMVPHDLDACSSGPGVQANFFRRNGGTDSLESMVATTVLPPGKASEVAPREQTASKSILCKHWDAINADGITASEFVAFLQPLADLDGITVSYIYSD